MDWHRGKKYGIMSACTANALCIEAASQSAVRAGRPVLIEATSNQVNQLGGYTGMRPSDFYDFALKIAISAGVTKSDIIIGGDHLGPLPFKELPAEEAMAKAEDLVREYSEAGFAKLHLDASMRLGGDDANARMSDELIAERTGRLAKAANEGYLSRKALYPDSSPPVFAIGSEVPIPGGAAEKSETAHITLSEDLHSAASAFREQFERFGLSDLWENVVGFVVQPGVEFGDAEVRHYDRTKAIALTDALKEHAGFVFEGHSTDYQTPERLKMMVEDGVCILKVGPALTFYLREAIFALESIEKEIPSAKIAADRSNYKATLENAMLAKPGEWKKHYSGDPDELEFKRKYSYSDRCRYYLPNAEVRKAFDRLNENLSGIDIPISLISQYMPIQAKYIRLGTIEKDPHSLIISRITDLIDEYDYAIRMQAGEGM
jgi:D-tagatose-1,6-bisphosphate aldolase subunit GatZ/KbaZ